MDNSPRGFQHKLLRYSMGYCEVAFMIDCTKLDMRHSKFDFP